MKNGKWKMDRLLRGLPFIVQGRCEIAHLLVTM
jgi:hypothetical protein